MTVGELINRLSTLNRDTEVKIDGHTVEICYDSSIYDHELGELIDENQELRRLLKAERKKNTDLMLEVRAIMVNHPEYMIKRQYNPKGDKIFISESEVE